VIIRVRNDPRPNRPKEPTKNYLKYILSKMGSCEAIISAEWISNKFNRANLVESVLITGRTTIKELEDRKKNKKSGLR